MLITALPIGKEQATDVLAPIVAAMPMLTWIHTLYAGVDMLMFPQVVDNPHIILTNAKGVYNSTLAEYVMGAVSYFTKNIQRLNEQKTRQVWDRFPLREIKGLKLGIVGYGDIGKACARLANAYGMDVVGLKRTISTKDGSPVVDPLLSRLYDKSGLYELMSTCDFVVCCLPITPETSDFIDSTALAKSKPGMILINIGRGPVINEDAMIAALESGVISGLALDVFNVESLPSQHKLWFCPNVLLSPHNADFTENYRHVSVRHFIENCRKVIAGVPLIGIVNKQLGY